MRPTPETLEFIHAPDTVDFVTRATDAFFDYAHSSDDVVLGFVDTGIDYTQDVFRYEDGSSKIQYIYDQTAEGDPPSGFLLGQEYSKADIDAALASVAAGKQTDDFTGAAPDAEIIAVKLKKARELDRPVVICIGLGTNAGSHDGESVFEKYLGGASIQKGVCLCAAAGNETEARHHTSGVLQPWEKPSLVDLKVGENAGDVYLAVWNTVADRISLSVRSPSGELVSRTPARPGGSGPAADVKLMLEAARVQVEYHFPVESSGGQLSIVRILGATPGVWTIQLHGDIVLNGQYHVWLPMTGFVSPSAEFLAATPDYTVTSPASAVGLICCGAYNRAEKSLYAKSSFGAVCGGSI